MLKIAIGLVAGGAVGFLLSLVSRSVGST